MLFRLFEARPRLMFSIFSGLVTYFLVAQVAPVSMHAVFAYDAALVCFLTLTWIMVLRSGLHDLRARAAEEDFGRWTLLGLLVGAACASLFVIAKLLSKKAMSSPGLMALHVAFSIITIFGSWSLIHTVFSLNYAHIYYELAGKNPQKNHASKTRGGFGFPGDKDPEYADFLYFSFVIGMTCQTSDVSVTTAYMRKVVLFHSIVTFFFNTAIVALTINLLAGLLD